jgi:hypothetical protein
MKQSETITPRQEKEKKKVAKSSTATKKFNDTTQKITHAFNQAIQESMAKNKMQNKNLMQLQQRANIQKGMRSPSATDKKSFNYQPKTAAAKSMKLPNGQML